MSNHAWSSAHLGVMTFESRLVNNLAFIAILALGSSACDREKEQLSAGEDLPVRSLVEDLRIGSRDDLDQSLTSRGTSLPVLPTTTGGVLVLQADEGYIALYDKNGSLIRRMGRQGEGPGEFRALASLGWWHGTPDTVWASDFALRRVSLFTGDGSFVRSIPLPQIQHGDSFEVTLPHAFAPNGVALAIASSAPGVINDGPVPILAYPLDTGAVQVLGALTRGSSLAIRWRGAPLASGMHPFSDAPLAAFAPDGSRIVVVDRSTERKGSPSIDLVAMTPYGDTLWSRTFRYRPQGLPQSEVDSLLTPRIESFKRFAQLEARLSDEEAEQAYRQSVTIPLHRPAIKSAHLSIDGRIWLEWSASPGAAGDWWVLTSDGEPVMVLRSPKPINPVGVAGEYLWAIELDELDVPFLVRYRADGTASDPIS